MRSALGAGDIDPRSVVGAGLTGQMYGLVLLDSEHRVLRPAILWNDQRTAEQCDAIRDRVGADRLVEVTGNDAMTRFTRRSCCGCVTTHPTCTHESRTSSCPRTTSGCS